MTIRRSPSAIRSGTGGTRGFLSGDTSEYRTDRHAEPRQIAFAENVAGHDFPRSEYVRARSRFPARPLNLGPVIHLYPEIRKRDSRPQWVSVKRRRVDALGPMGFRRLNSLSAAVIQYLMIKGSGPDGLIECQDGGFKFPGRQSQRYRQLLDARRGNRRKHRWHETP